MLAHLLLIHAAATWSMVGLIWFVQAVHYPLFAEVGSEQFVQYERLHQQRTTWVVMPLMLVELASAAALAFWRGSRVSSVWAGIGLLLLGMIWLSTFLVQVPLHAQLAGGFKAEVHRRLVATNWWRTVLWTARGVLALALVWPWLSQGLTSE
jgi:hypothetical protein